MAGAYHDIVPFDGMWIVSLFSDIIPFLTSRCFVSGYE
jgi:hypothetical protein